SDDGGSNFVRREDGAAIVARGHQIAIHHSAGLGRQRPGGGGDVGNEVPVRVARNGVHRDRIPRDDALRRNNRSAAVVGGFDLDRIGRRGGDDERRAGVASQGAGRRGNGFGAGRSNPQGAESGFAGRVGRDRRGAAQRSAPVKRQHDVSAAAQ